MTSNEPGLATEFLQAMDDLGPFEAHPALGVAVSGGADSMALVILARDWARRRNGSVLALVVDHGLRAESGQDARLTIQRLSSLGIPAKLLILSNLAHGAGLAERARIARYRILSEACRAAGLLHLLLGHHAADQTETLAMRVLRGSQTKGLAGMSALRETRNARVLRPLLCINPGRLRSFLTARDAEWIEDPSNHDLRALRPRLRHQLRTLAPGVTGLEQAILTVASYRAREEIETGSELARRVTIRPEGFAVLSPGRVGPAALSAVMQTIAGAHYPPSPTVINQLARQPRPATLGGVRLLEAGRVSDGWLIVREEAAVLPPIKARPDSLWDNRFRLVGPVCDEAEIGRLGADAARMRGTSDLPSVVLRTLPAIRIGGFLAAVPHMGYARSADDAALTVLFSPRRPLAGVCFVPASPSDGS